MCIMYVILCMCIMHVNVCRDIDEWDSRAIMVCECQSGTEKPWMSALELVSHGGDGGGGKGRHGTSSGCENLQFCEFKDIVVSLRRRYETLTLLSPNLRCDLHFVGWWIRSQCLMYRDTRAMNTDREGSRNTVTPAPECWTHAIPRKTAAVFRFVDQEALGTQRERDKKIPRGYFT